MLARRDLSPTHAAWNRRWGAPAGRSEYLALTAENVTPDAARAAGPFAAQPNSTTRRVEYPWAFHAVPVRQGMRVVEIGGGLSGLQFVLSAAEAAVINVDPFEDYGSGTSAVSDPERFHARMNTWFGTDVELRACTLSEARIETAAIDVVYCISTLEHLEDAEIEEILDETARILRPGGRLVLTVDLFLDLHPFTAHDRNTWGRNLSIPWVIGTARMPMVVGDRAELAGFPEFSARRTSRDRTATSRTSTTHSSRSSWC